MCPRFDPALALCNYRASMACNYLRRSGYALSSRAPALCNERKQENHSKDCNHDINCNRYAGTVARNTLKPFNFTQCNQPTSGKTPPLSISVCFLCTALSSSWMTRHVVLNVRSPVVWYNVVRIIALMENLNEDEESNPSYFNVP